MSKIKTKAETKDATVELSDSELDRVQGGFNIGMPPTKTLTGGADSKVMTHPYLKQESETSS
jgi:transcription termination factor Rho